MNELSQVLSSYNLLTKENGTEQDSHLFWQECFEFQTILKRHLMIFFFFGKGRQFSLWQYQWKITYAKVLILVQKFSVVA